MFKPHKRYTAEFPVIAADQLPEYGELVHLKFKGWYQNDLIFVVWPVGVKRRAEDEGRHFLWVQPEDNLASFDTRVQITGSGEPPEHAMGYITDSKGKALLECWPIQFIKA